MNVLHITLEYPPIPGGGATYVHGLATAQARHMKKTKVHVLTSGEKDASVLEDNVIVIRRAGLKGALANILLSAEIIDHVLAVIDNVKPDIIHAHHTIPILICQAISSVYPIRYVMTQHRTPEEPGRPIKADGKGLLAEYAYSAGSCGQWIAPSYFFRDRLLQSGVQSEGLNVIWPSIQFERFEYDAVNRAIFKKNFYKLHGIDEDLPLIVLPVVNRPRKDVDFSLKAIAGSAVSCAVVITGVGNAHVNYPQYTKHETLHLVEHEGFASDDIAKLYAVADGVVLASTREGFGLAAIEALAAGTRVFLRQSPGLAEIIQQQPSVYAFETTEQLSLLLQVNLALIRKASVIRSQQQAVRESFSPKRQVVLHSEVYSSVLSEVFSAGGVCIYGEAENLKIRLVKDSRGDYVLPKGHVKRGETWEATALREISEESGLTVIAGGRFIADIRYSFTNEDNQEMAKKVRFYAYRIAHNETHELSLEANEDIVSAEWINPGEALSRMKFKSEYEIIQRAIKGIV